jgi:predicted Zn-dependent protease
MTQISKRLVREAPTISFKTELAQRLVAARNITMSYQQAIAQIAETQFDDLQQVDKIIAQISELNTVKLQDVLKLEPKNSHCHSLIAMVYLRQNQLKMAKIHFDNALKLNPKEKTALEWKPKVDKALGITSGGSQLNSSAKTQEKQPDKSGNGTLFGGLFGGKKK